MGTVKLFELKAKGDNFEKYSLTDSSDDIGCDRMKSDVQSTD